MRMEDKRQPAFEDTDLMPLGKYKGEPLQDVPAEYLKWFWENTDIKTIKLYGNKSIDEVPDWLADKIKLANYIWNSLDAINLELKGK